MIPLDIQVKIDYHRKYCIEKKRVQGGDNDGKVGFAG